MDARSVMTVPIVLLMKQYDISILLFELIQMKQEIAVILDEEVKFLDKVAKGNRSDYLNNLLSQQRKLILETELITALPEDIEDPDYQQEIKEWDHLAGDGIAAER